MDPQIFSHIKFESKISDLGTVIRILHRQMTEQMSFEIDVKMVKNWKKCTFLVQMHYATQFFLAHMKFKSKISYLGKGISILHRQMTELWSFEVTIKKFMDEHRRMELLFFLIFITYKYDELEIQGP